MKKFSKFVLILGGGLFFGGILLALICLAIGGDVSFIARRLDNMVPLHFYQERAALHEWSSPSYYNEEFTARNATPPGEPAEYEIKNLELSFGLGDVSIITGEDFELIYGNDNTRRFYSERVSGDKWVVSSKKTGWSWLDPWSRRRNDIKLTVVLPRDFIADNMVVSLGAGNMQAEYLRAREVFLDVGLGNCHVGGVEAENARLNVGVGYLEARSFSAGQATLEVGLGNCQVGGVEVENARLDVGLGNMELSLAQSLDQYRCHVDVGLGSVQLGGNTYNGVANVTIGDGDAPRSLDISCGLGSVKIEAER